MSQPPNFKLLAEKLKKQRNTASDSSATTNGSDAKAAEEKKWAEDQYQIEVKKEQARKLKQENDFASDENDARKSYGNRVFWLMVFWLATVLVIVIASGIPLLQELKYFQLSEKIILTLIGTTTINIIGLFGFVMKYLFAPKKA